MRAKETTDLHHYDTEGYIDIPPTWAALTGLLVKILTADADEFVSKDAELRAKVWAKKKIKVMGSLADRAKEFDPRGRVPTANSLSLANHRYWVGFKKETK
tara:strand:- start:144 stop:446 length:303 start_codon:yes stop_codon:yes gene_type:complete